MRKSESSLSRALALLDAFGSADNELPLVELAARTGLPVSTAHRMVVDLVSWGGLERTRSGLRLGLRLFELGHLVSPQRTLREIALPYLEDLYESTHKTVNLAVRDGVEIVYVEKLVSRGVHARNSRAGGRLPIHATAMGKAILAFSSQETVNLLIEAGLRPLTPKTITDPARLRRELALIRQQRIAYDIEESQLGIMCAGAPLVHRNGDVVGALSVTDVRSTAEAHRLGTAVLIAALSLSRDLSDRGSLEGATSANGAGRRSSPGVAGVLAEHAKDDGIVERA